MSNTTALAFKAYTYELLDELRRFWFEHIDDENYIVLPDFNVMRRFFVGDDAFDGLCVEKFTPALQEIRAFDITSSSDLLSALPPRHPFDWLAIILLLDQVPRNCYRGKLSGPVYSFYDPLSLGVTLEALEKGIFLKSPILRWNFTYRFWLVLPLIHSESLEIHDRIENDVFVDYQADIDALLAASSERDDGSEERARAVKVVQERADGARFLVNGQREQEEKHVVILRQFGRYPHRNEPLGREMTEEEQKYLDEGGVTFAPPRTVEDRAKWEAARQAESGSSKSK